MEFTKIIWTAKGWCVVSWHKWIK